jgi:hypothetical protein
LFDAPSISITSRCEPSAIALHAGSLTSNSAFGPSVQFSAFAKIRAVEVLPVPRGPTKRYACAMRLRLIAFFNVRTTWSWPTTSANVWGRHFRAMT